MSSLSKVQCTILLDNYESLLTDKQRTIMRMYSDLDYSLAEIAEHQGISRQAVRDAIVSAENTLIDVDSKLHIVKDKQDFNKLLLSIKEFAKKQDYQSILDLLKDDIEE